MSKNHEPLKNVANADDPFASFFAQAEESPRYWAELAKLEFTEKVLERMKELGVNRSGLAARLNVQPGLVTRLLGGQNNFELATMTKIARALDCEFRCHLQPQGTETMWINVLKEKPQPLQDSLWDQDHYSNVLTENYSPSHNEAVAA